MGPKPEVNAFLMEHVAAHGQEAEEAVVLELQQANGTFEAVVLIFAMEFLHGSVGKGREDLKQRRIEASVRGCSGGWGVKATDDVACGGALDGPGIEDVHETASTQVDDAEAEDETYEDAEGEGYDHRRRGVHCSRLRVGLVIRCERSHVKLLTALDGNTEGKLSRKKRKEED